MLDLSSGSFNLAFDSLVAVRVSGINSIGQGQASSVNTSGARIRRVPSAMTVPSKSFGDMTSITLSWTALSSASDTGNSPITEYNIYWDQGSGGSATSSIYLGASTSYTITGLSTGSNYKFKVRAKNVYGYGPFSAEVTLQASTVPGIINAVTSGYATYPNIEISWNAPSSNGGAAVSKYQILIYNPSTSSYVEDLSYCDGSSFSVMANTKCTFTVNYLMSTYSYSLGEIVKAQVRAYNTNGWASYSSPN